MAAEKGLIPEVVRIEHELLNAIYPGLTAGGYAASANDVAAMPSVHLGLTVLPMMAMASFMPRTRVTAWIYGLTMLLAITYLGEHYAVDGVVGAGMAWGAWWLAGAYLQKRRTREEWDSVPVDPSGVNARPAPDLPRSEAPPSGDPPPR
jgi:membrane-associated phospholipid phosphatase